jgi:cystathionine beta-lyase family protein involved in aluminum resistance
LKEYNQIINDVEGKCKETFQKYSEIAAFNQEKVLKAFIEHRVNEACFKGTTGYGYGDYGRDTLDAIFASIFKAEQALVRGQIVSGTHAISLVLFGILKPGDRVVSVTGTPYDTLLKVIGYPDSNPCSLTEMGVSYNAIELDAAGKPDHEKIVDELSKHKTKLVMIQRSRGYSWRDSLSIDELECLIQKIKAVDENIIVFVDNCYGEFVEKKEPIEVGADLIAGSLIKNPGGGLAPTGGYIAGKEEYIERISYRLTAPGIGAEVGSYSGEFYRLLYQGIFMAPNMVLEALKGAIFTAKLLTEFNYDVLPQYDAHRSDIVQSIKLNSPEKIIQFCKGLQEYSPLDSYVTPEPWDMPGYENQVIMAGGTFIQGATLELSADAPIREPYIVYLQGGLSYLHTKLAISHAVKRIIE